ncbi:MAG: hypothetical protein GTO13_23110 [Proteobacteria bacterium]|nr:hypothetical protein [Pseudomonadota bacterium]
MKRLINIQKSDLPELGRKPEYPIKSQTYHHHPENKRETKRLSLKGVNSVTTRYFLILFSMLLILLVLGCARVVKMYPGEKLPREEIAKIREPTEKFVPLFLAYVCSDAQIVAVDGKRVEDYYAEAVEVTPGFHEVLVQLEKDFEGGYFSTPGPGSTYNSFLRFNFHAGAGHEYKIKIPDWWKRCSFVSIVDTQSGEVITSKRIGGRTYSLSEYTGYKFPEGFWNKPGLDAKQLKKDCQQCMRKSWKSIKVRRGSPWEPFLYLEVTTGRGFEAQYMHCMEGKGYSWQESHAGTPLGLDTETYFMDKCLP